MTRIAVMAVNDPSDPRSDQRAARTRAMLEAPIGPTLAKLAAPNVLAMFVQAAQNTISNPFWRRCLAF